MTAPLNEPEIVGGRPADEPPQPAPPSSPAADPNQLGRGPVPQFAAPNAPPSAPFATSRFAQLGANTNVLTWTSADDDTLEFMLRSAFDGIDERTLAGVSDYVKKGTTSSVMKLPIEKFRKQARLTTKQMFDDSALRRMLGVTDDTDALANAAIDTWLASGQAAITASQVFARGDAQRRWVTDNFLEDRERRERVLAEARTRAGLNDLPLAQYGDEITGLRGKQLQWTVSGNELALRWIAEDGLAVDDEGNKTPTEFTDVLIHLDEGTKVLSTTDAIAEYLLADGGIKNVVDPSSGDVPGRQNFIGALIEGTNDVIRSVERFGTGFLTEGAINTESELSRAMTVTSPLDEERDDESLDEQFRIDATKRDLRTNSIVHIVRAETAKNPELSMSNAVKAGILGFSLVPDDVIESAAVSQIQDLDSAAAKKREDLSFLGRFIEEDVGPPILNALSVWDGWVQYIGIVASDLTNLDASAQIVKLLADEGIDGLLSNPRLLVDTLMPLGVDVDSLLREMENVRDEGVPKALAAYNEAADDLGDLATYYGIDPESGYATWVNLVGSIGFDPLTFLTLGGNASWSGLKTSMATSEGIERVVRSRPMMSMAKNIVVKNDSAMLPLIAEGNMSSGGVRRIAEILKTDYNTIAEKAAGMDDVLRIVQQEMEEGFMLPTGPARAYKRKTTLGLGKLVKASSTDPKARSFLRDILTRASSRRYASITDKDFLDEMFSWAEIRHAGNRTRFADDVTGFVDSYDAYRAGDEAIAMLEGKVTALRNELSDLGAANATPTGKMSVPQMRGTISEWNDSIKELDRRIAGLSDTADPAAMKGLEKARAKALAGRDQAHDILNKDDFAKNFDDRRVVIADKQTELKKNLLQIDELGTSARDRTILEHELLRYIDDWADELGVPVKVGADGEPLAHPFVEGLPARDWSDVVGRDAARRFDTATAKSLEPFGEKNAEELGKIGMQAPAGVVPLPVSPTELLLWNQMRRNKLTRAWWQAERSRAAVKSGMDTIQSIWSMQVLFNPLTALRSNLDETVRFFENNGMNADLLKSSTPRALTGGVGPEARAFARNELDSFLPAQAVSWDMVSPSKRGMWVHAERWVNGTIVKDKLFRGYARAITNGTDETAQRALWKEFWDDEGVKLAKRATTGGTPLDDRATFDIIHKSFNDWSGQIDTAKSAVNKVGVTGKTRVTSKQVVDDMIAAAARSEQVNWPKAVWRQLPEVPAQVTNEAGSTVGNAFSSATNAGFKLGYGAPQSRRGSVFFDHANDFAVDVFNKRFDGRVVTEEWLMSNGHAATRFEAQELVNQGRRSPVVRELVRESGMVMADDITDAAMRWAGKQADDMMYSFGATSILGKKIARIFPFGRAQVDYMQWWWTKLKQPTNLIGSRQVGVRGGTKRLAAGIPTGGANLRLIDRMAKLVTLGDPDQRPGSISPAGMVNNFTFLPTSIDNQLVVDTTISFGPTAGWAVNAPFVPEAARNAVAEVVPSVRIFSKPYEDYYQWVRGFADSMFPSSGLSVRNQALAAKNLLLLGAAAASLNYDPSKPFTDDEQRRINSTINSWVMNASAGPWYNDYIKLDTAKWVTDHQFDKVPDNNAESEVMQEWAFRNEAAAVSALTDSSKNFYGRMAGLPTYGGSDFQYVETLVGVGDFVDAWVESGSISDAKRDAINTGLEAFNSGESTARQRLLFADETLDAVFVLLTKDERAEFVAMNPGVSANFVSFYEVVPGLPPTDVIDAIDGNRIKTNDLNRARELRRRGLQEGWLRFRDPTEVQFDMAISVQRANREYLDVIYERMTGLGISKRSIDGTGLDKKRITIDPEWWNRHKDWLGKAQFDESVLGEAGAADLTAGISVDINAGDFRRAFLQTKDLYRFTFAVSNDLEVKLNRISASDRPMSQVGARLSTVPGFKMSDFDQTVGMSYYGRDLMDDFNKALAAGQKYGGWGSMEEWDGDWIEIPNPDVEDETVRYSKDDFRGRFRVAIALSQMTVLDSQQFTEKDYSGSIFDRNLGELDWEPPTPPFLSEVKSFYETGETNLLNIIDGDTISVDTDGGPVFLRLLGINTPERGDPGYRAAWEGLNAIVKGADKVQFAIWEPDRYGLKMTTLTKDDKAVVERDRLFVWLYVDGVPLYDPNEFSRGNVRGVRTGGDPEVNFAGHLEQLLEQSKQKQRQTVTERAKGR